MKNFNIILLLLLSLSFIGCEKKVHEGPYNVHFDRDLCAECRMVISDRNYVAQLVDNTHSEAYNFDDIGCLFLWLQEHNDSWIQEANIYIADVKSAKFLEAKKAFWSQGHTTPMDFGLAAHERKPEGKLIGYEEAKKIALTPKPEKSNSMKCGPGKCGGNKCGAK